jgi:HAD superfamily hydrolase (TIGR01662 family)
MEQEKWSGQPTIRTVLFDFDGTLVFHEPDTFDLISDFCTEIGQPLDAETERLGRRTRHEYFVDPLIRRRLGRFSRDEFWTHFNRHLLQAVGIEGNLAQLATRLTDSFSRTEFVYECPEAGLRTLDGLRSRGYDLGLITNRDNVERFYELLDELGLGHHFAMTLASGEVGIRKPEPGIFFAALDQMVGTPEESVYVGDNYWADVVGAQRAGLTPFLLDPRGLFPECECLVLAQIDELLTLLP